ncbi:MAG: hypothetical protein ACK41T_00900 [Pseudobdellovibrio sp.]
MLFKYSLPQVYQSFLSREILSLDINETKATCDKCLRARDKRFPYPYKENLKCCTFVPFIPNFAVGGILSEKLEGADLIYSFIKEKKFTLPLGVFPDFDYQYRFQNKSKQDFGRDENLLCHYYDKKQNRCSIWKYRGVVCTTFFCRSSYGAKGNVFWESVKDYLSYVEMALAEDCLVMKDFSPRDISDQLFFLNKTEFNKSEIKQKTISEKDWRLYWNGYSDPVSFYISCYDLVKKQKRSSFKEIIGEQGLKLEKNVKELGRCL